MPRRCRWLPRASHPEPPYRRAQRATPYGAVGITVAAGVRAAHRIRKITPAPMGRRSAGLLRGPTSSRALLRPLWVARSASLLWPRGPAGSGALLRPLRATSLLRSNQPYALDDGSATPRFVIARMPGSPATPVTRVHDMTKTVCALF